MYYVIEIQTTAETGSVLPLAYADRKQAESAYHQKLASAAISEIPKHGCMLCTEDMYVLKSEVYTHTEE